MALKQQKEAERAEQQRIKNLVLNYDLTDSSADQAGTDNINLYLDHFSHPNPNLSHILKPKHFTHNTVSQGPGGEKQRPAHPHNAPLQQAPIANAVNSKPAERSGGGRRGQQARKLQLSDVDWYAPEPDLRKCCDQGNPRE